MVQAARQPEKPKAVKPRRSLLRSGLGRRRASVHTGTDRVREKEILAATRSVLTERGYANFTLRGIAEAAGLSLSHLQYYFPTKAEIVSALFADVGNDYEQAYVAFLARIYGGPEERLSAWIEFLLDDSWDPETRAASSSNCGACSNPKPMARNRFCANSTRLILKKFRGLSLRRVRNYF